MFTQSVIELGQWNTNFPALESNGIDDRGLNNFSAGKHSPGYGCSLILAVRVVLLTLVAAAVIIMLSERNRSGQTMTLYSKVMKLEVIFIIHLY